MKLNFKNITLLAGASFLMMSCSRNEDSPGYEYMPDMYRSQAIEAYVDYGLVSDDENEELKNTMSARIPADGTIPFNADPAMASIMMPYSTENTTEGYEESKFNKIPSSYIETEEIANAHAKDGAKLFTYFCSHCHGAKGAGDGKVVTYGEYNPPSPYNGGYKDRTLGQIFHVITYGKGAMGPHGSQLNKDERWKVALHVRTLQHGNLNYAELLGGLRIGEEEKVFGQVDLPSIKVGEYVSLRGINFAPGSSELTNQAKVELDSLNSYLIAYPNVKMEIAGHTDNTGAEENNIVLSKERANSVVTYLVAKGVVEGRLVAAGYGSAMPIAINDPETGSAKNRRIEFVKIK